MEQSDDASQVDNATLLDCVRQGGETGALAEVELRHRLAALSTIPAQQEPFEKRARELSKVITDHLGGGSEWFSRIGYEFYADPAIVAAELRRRKTDAQITKRALLKANASTQQEGRAELADRLEALFKGYTFQQSDPLSELLPEVLSALRAPLPQAAKDEGEPVTKAWAKFDHWFFKECNEGTRRHLFAQFGLPVDEIRNHGHERHALRFVRKALRSEQEG